MITLFGLRQQQLLTMLLQNKEGLTVEDLSKGLGIQTMPSDNTYGARARWYGRERRNPVHGRPTRTPLPPYHFGAGAISASLLLVSELLINSLREEQGTDAWRERLEGMGKAVGR